MGSHEKYICNICIFIIIFIFVYLVCWWSITTKTYSLLLHSKFVVVLQVVCQLFNRLSTTKLPSTKKWDSNSYDPKDKQVDWISSKKCRRLLQEQIRHIYQGFNWIKRVMLIGMIISYIALPLVLRLWSTGLTVRYITLDSSSDMQSEDRD
jgi:hypothetical protein